MSKKHVLLFLSFTILTLLSSACISPNPSIVYHDVTSFLPPEQNYSISVYSKTGEKEYAFKNSLVINQETKTAELRTTTPDYSYHAYLNQDMQIVQGELRFFHPEQIEQLGYDRRFTVQDYDTNKVITQFSKYDQNSFRSDFEYDVNTVDVESLPYYIQSIVTRGEDEFIGTLIDINSGKGYYVKMDIINGDRLNRFIKRSKAPETIKDILKNEDVTLYSIGMQGISRILVPYKYYVVLENETPHRIRIFWGESSKTYSFQVYESFSETN